MRSRPQAAGTAANQPRRGGHDGGAQRGDGAGRHRRDRLSGGRADDGRGRADALGPGRPRDHPRSRRRPRPEQPGRGALEDGEVADALAALAARRPCYELSAPMWRTWRASPRSTIPSVAGA